MAIILIGNWALVPRVLLCVGSEQACICILHDLHCIDSTLTVLLYLQEVFLGEVNFLLLFKDVSKINSVKNNFFLDKILSLKSFFSQSN